ncbi:hypothetical protein ABEI56_05585 [Peribacillus castrilensis]|uniref:hypothetical protein n=1 Tax=Peribacillus castrilensis TaxID=2897690 RepID=UPI003D29307C
MPFTKALPEWNEPGSVPPQEFKDNGWGADQHPPADWFNWFFNTTFKALQELQLNAADKTAATTALAGLMSATDKLKLNGVATGANNYVHPATHPPSIIAQDSSNLFTTAIEKSNWNSKETPTGAQAKATAVRNELFDQSLLWSGGVYPMAADTITPSKKLSECPNGWILVWSDYDVGSGSNDYQFVFTFVPKTFPTLFPGKANAYFQIPNYISETKNETTIKELNFTDSTIKGVDLNKNSTSQSDDVVLRRVLAF